VTNQLICTFKFSKDVPPKHYMPANITEPPLRKVHMQPCLCLMYKLL